jgi:deferrochelatase/peroxidase EfeB
MLHELIDRERDESDGISVWDATFPIGQVLVADPGSPTPATAFGSYFVFRKLEQNVNGFKGLEESMGQDPTLGKLGELMGATLVGRFEDGTPVVLQREDGMDNPVPNNFDYAGDPNGLRCPLHAHIRKSNPRGDSVREFPGTTLADERGHIMARRGMTFGTRNAVTDPSDEPQGGVGLMFMAYQKNLANQFEFTQASWVNNPDFVRGQFNQKPAVGSDPVIGQTVPGGTSLDLQVRTVWGKADCPVKPATFGGFVRNLGGEYFFTPARSTLANI